MRQKEQAANNNHTVLRNSPCAAGAWALVSPAEPREIGLGGLTPAIYYYLLLALRTCSCK